MEITQEFDILVYMQRVNEWANTRPRPLADDRNKKSSPKGELSITRNDKRSIEGKKEKSISIAKIFKKYENSIR